MGNNRLMGQGGSSVVVGMNPGRVDGVGLDQGGSQKQFASLAKEFKGAFRRVGYGTGRRGDKENDVFGRAGGVGGQLYASGGVDNNGRRG